MIRILTWPFRALWREMVKTANELPEDPPVSGWCSFYYEEPATTEVVIESKDQTHE